MNLTIVTILLVGFMWTHSVAEPLTSGDPISTNLILVATVDGKSFFADYTDFRNWEEAGAYCAGLGMKLADISSKAQSDALQAAYNPSFEGHYWTSARDVQQRKQFVWNSTETGIANNFPSFETRNIGYQSCLSYNSQALNKSALQMYKCTDKMGTLCNT